MKIFLATSRGSLSANNVLGHSHPLTSTLFRHYIAQPVAITRATVHEIPQYFKRLFEHKSIQQTLREGHGELSRGLSILSRYANSRDSTWVTAQFVDQSDCLNQLMVYLTQNAYSEVLHWI